MKFAKALSEAEAKRVQSLILFGGILTTLAIWTNLEDPVNLPKMFVLVLSASIIFGLISQGLLHEILTNSRSNRLALILVTLFSTCLLITTISTDVVFTAIFGEFHRNNGFLSYFAMVVLMAASSIAFGPQTASRYFRFYSILGILVGTYGALQVLGKDPVDWVITYNPVITTLGNPNFTSGILGLSSVATFYALIENRNLSVKLIYGLGLLISLFSLIKSGSVQGLFGFSIGVAAILLVKAWTINKKLGLIGLIAGAIGSVPVFLALINVGPLANKIYQGTLRNRFDYWSAALNMFKDHPIFGVGIDRFGEFYRQYAVQNQVVQGQITDNAHSIYMQILATGGLTLFIPYLLLIVFITYRGLRHLLSAKDSEKLQAGAIFGIWLSTLAVNLVTVDNLGVGVWFWITGGVIIGVTSKEVVSLGDKNLKSKFSNVKKRSVVSNSSGFPLTSVFSGFLAILMLITLLPIMTNSANLKVMIGSQPVANSNSYALRVKELASQSQNDAQNLLQLSALAYKATDIALGDAIVERVFELDKRSFYANYFKAFTLEALEKRADAIPYRERLVELDPWNNANLIELIKNYLAAGDKASAEEVARLIKRNYPGSQSDIDAAALLAG